jgi:hypothetical protein
MPIYPAKVGDVDGDCLIDISDFTRMIDYLFITFEPLQVGCGEAVRGPDRGVTEDRLGGHSH